MFVCFFSFLPYIDAYLLFLSRIYSADSLFLAFPCWSVRISLIEPYFLQQKIYLFWGSKQPFFSRIFYYCSWDSLIGRCFFGLNGPPRRLKRYSISPVVRFLFWISIKKCRAEFCSSTQCIESVWPRCEIGEKKDCFVE